MAGYNILYGIWQDIIQFIECIVLFILSGSIYSIIFHFYQHISCEFSFRFYLISIYYTYISYISWCNHCMCSDISHSKTIALALLSSLYVVESQVFSYDILKVSVYKAESTKINV